MVSKKTIPKKKDDSFATVAKRLECDEDKAAFEKNLGKIAKAKGEASASEHSKGVRSKTK
jgi:hypothetical protein